jgi:hypothetical protein
VPKAGFLKNHAELILGVLCYLAALVLIHPWGNFPLNDDWCYAREAFYLATTGRIQIIPTQAAWGLPQIFVGALIIKVFGLSHAKLRLVGIFSAVGSAAILAKYFETQVVSRFVRFMAILAFLFFPPLFMSSLSFMTDAPFLFLWLCSCFCWDLAYRKPDIASVGRASLITVLCFSQRQFGLLLSALSLVFYFVVERGERKQYGKEENTRARYLFVGAFLVQLAAYFAISTFWSRMLQVPQVIEIFPHALDGRVLYNSFEGLSYVGIAGAPFIFPSVIRFFREVRQERRLLGALGILSFLAVLFTSHLIMKRGLFMPYFENAISKFGMFSPGEVFTGPMPELFPQWAIWILTALSSVSAVVLMVRYLEWLGRPRGFLIFSGFIYLFTISILLGIPFDRYLLPVFAAGLLLLVRDEKPLFLKKLICGTFVTLFIAGSLVIGDYYMRWNEAKWSGAEWLLQQGFPARRIDAGYEWMNWWKYANGPDGVAESLPNQVQLSFEGPNDQGVIREFGFKSWILDGNLVAKKK